MLVENPVDQVLSWKLPITGIQIMTAFIGRGAYSYGLYAVQCRGVKVPLCSCRYGNI